ncbi:hypothetical protein DSECCO2_390320 [anaerobic digester metagenome]
MEIPEELEERLNPEQPRASLAARAQRSMPATAHGIRSAMPGRVRPTNDTMEDLLTEETATPGAKVVHPKFGNGMIVGMSREANDIKLQILFDTYGLKSLLLSLAPLKLRQE